ncbi:aspartate aminotransferase family protein [Oscillochloris sp. ZM17-4]|uniref:aminotransferase family protein n=1 Tax=Oscillochloris sp. ZM17-4 TaxID=2866714 RepID=UPI001C73BF70|nr:aspartate aminotransferase family protein [Oscillochloris sp. ZM17-4]MBX0331475.1 aspartate aminotransferase family protein [Oscillochloris sp. ZM17-4]
MSTDTQLPADSLAAHAAAYDQPVYQKALDHVWIHTVNYVELAEKRGMHVFDRGEGSTLYDVRGDQWIDALSGLWVVNAGHGRAEIADAMAAQARKLAYVSSAAYTSVPSVQLAETLAELTPGDLSRVFFSSGGSEAVETAIKIAKQVQVLRGFPKRYKIIARRGSYHGMTYGAMSLTTGNRTAQERFFGPLMDGVYHVPSPNRYRNDFGLEGEEGDLMCARWVEQEIMFQGPETVAAVIGEPISSSNGVHIPAPGYWKLLREICDRHGVLLIMDEVINGFGRTGAWFATEHFGVTPDIMTMAKGLSSGYAPIAATIVRPSVFEVFTSEKNTVSHLLTFGGQAVAAAAALKNIEIIGREGLVERAAEMGAYLMAGLRGLMDTHPTVGDARGLGLLCAIELVKDKGTKEKWPRDSDFIKRVGELVLERRMLTRVWELLHIAPPLVITREEIDRMVTILDESLGIAEREFGLA